MYVKRPILVVYCTNFQGGKNFKRWWNNTWSAENTTKIDECERRLSNNKQAMNQSSVKNKAER